jgi:3-methylcrotonyl-CoA carboxylase beta subunit
MHARVSGLADYLVENEAEAISKARSIMEHLRLPTAPNLKQLLAKKAPLLDLNDIFKIVSTDMKRPFDTREIIARLVDESTFLPFKSDFGPTLICGMARLADMEIGVLANNVILFPDAAIKGAQFIQRCESERRPLLFLQNVPGFMVGKQVEQAGIIRHGASMIRAVSTATVPMVTLLMGASFGAGNYAMCGRAYAPRFLFAWPNSKLAVMGGEQLSGVLEIIKREGAAKRGKPLDEEKLQQAKRETVEQIERESDAWYATARGWDDGIINPLDTRSILAHAFYISQKRSSNENDNDND